jgi:outer membrane receptor protein involved in Fe transport
MHQSFRSHGPRDARVLVRPHATGLLASLILVISSGTSHAQPDQPVPVDKPDDTATPGAPAVMPATAPALITPTLSPETAPAEPTAPAAPLPESGAEEPDSPAFPSDDAAVSNEVIVVEGHAPAESASSVSHTQEDLRRVPRIQPSDILRQTPGLVVAQHAGGGKADQLFLRGFDGDHGTDVALFLDGIPVNLTSHGHGQGYADTHWLIPETIARVDVHKGPYAARYGDFYTAGAIEMKTIDHVPGLAVWLTTGTELAGPVGFQRPSYRIVGMGSPQLAAGKALLAADIGYTDGPFLDQQNFRRTSALGKWTSSLGQGALTIATTFYAARWNQSGQIPATEVDEGRLDRFDALDPTEGGASSRTSAALTYESTDDGGSRWRLHAYGVSYRLRLYSNFTLFSRDLMNGDQIEQTDSRALYGANGTYQRSQRWGNIQGMLHAGLQIRADDALVDLWHTRERMRLPDCFGVANPCNRTDNRIRNLGAFVEEDLTLTDWLQVIAGLRFDQFVWDVEDLDPETALMPETTGGSAQRAIASPKLSLIVRPAPEIDVFVNGGRGFHSNDARAAVAESGRGALAHAYGAELGTRVRPAPGLRASLAAWYLYLSSEQVWSGDFGGTEPSDPTRRLGLDMEVAWDATPWLAFDANLALARSTFVANRGNGGALALAPKVMGGGGITARHGTSLASLRARGIGDRPANDDGSLTAEGYLLFDLVASHRRGPAELTLTVQNLLNTQWREAQFAEESRVTPDVEIREDVHFTPGAPLTAMVTLGVTY